MAEITKFFVDGTSKCCPTPFAQLNNSWKIQEYVSSFVLLFHAWKKHTSIHGNFQSIESLHLQQKVHGPRS